MTRKSERIARSRRRRLRALVHAIVASAIAVVIGVSGAGATYAFLSSTAPAGQATTLTAGTLTIQINGASSAALGPFAVSPSVPVAKAFSVKNTGNAPATLDAVIGAVTTPAITAHALARVTEVADSAACVPGLAGPQGALQGYAGALTGGSLQPAATRWYCLEVSLPAGTPATVSGQGFSFNMTVNATQSAS